MSAAHRAIAIAPADPSPLGGHERAINPSANTERAGETRRAKALSAVMLEKGPQKAIKPVRRGNGWAVDRDRRRALAAIHAEGRGEGESHRVGDRLDDHLDRGHV